MNEPKRTWREAQAETAAAEAEAHWGMTLMPDDRAISVQESARLARERGDVMFQVDLPVLWVQGYAFAGSSASRVRRPEPYDYLGAIEREGWTLEHVATSFVPNGSSATKRVGHNVGSTYVAGHGVLIGTYVFRRA